MRPLLHLLRTLGGDNRAATAVEYGLIAALIVIAAMGAIISVASVTKDMWNDVSEKVQSSH